MQVRWEKPRIEGRRFGTGLVAIMRVGRFNRSDFRRLSGPRLTLPENDAGFAGTQCARRYRLCGKNRNHSGQNQD